MAKMTQRETEIAFAKPSLGVNKALISVGPHGCRIAFVEDGGNGIDPVLAVAVLMTPEVALDMAKMVMALVGQAGGKQ